jgi:hypothetical protein
VLLGFVFLSSCDIKDKNESADKESSVEFVRNLLSQTDELSEKQQSAFDALNTLQTSSEEVYRLYSTFANIPMQGFWVSPGILGRRDLILRW